MKKLLGLLLCFSLTISLLSQQIVFADETKAELTSQAQSIEPELSADSVDSQELEPKDYIEINLTMIPRVQVVDSVAVLELYNSNGKKLSEVEEWVGGITKELNIKFEVPEINAGDKFILRLKSGLVYLKYYENTYGAGDEIELETYFSSDENIVSSFALEACPLYEQAIVVYIEGRQLGLYPRARLVDNIAMVPVIDVCQELGIKTRYDDKYNSVVCSVGDKEVLFNVGTAYATIFGTDTYLPRICEEIDGKIYVPIRSRAEAFGSEIETFDFGDHIDVCLSESNMVYEYMQKFPVNKWGITSRTGYLVWVDKSDYRVRVYTGSQYKWEEIKSFPCAIGAPSTPTITGSYEYQYRMQAWYYDSYYVGPCLVFHGGYALHSTLLKYNGTPYDNRTGVMISHGCVRMQKPHIDWLSANLPLGSRIYITE